jgi:transposase-like protein
MKQDEERMLSGNVECDEMYLGGRETNKHNKRKTEGTQGCSTKTKTPIFGMVETSYTTDVNDNPQVHTHVRAMRVEACNAQTIMGIIEDNVAPGSCITTDELGVYNAIDRSGNRYYHSVVCHKDKEFTNKEGFTTNRIEGFWGGFKRMVFGTYHMVNRSYLPRYIDESVFRYNTKELTEGQRFELMFDIAFGKKYSWSQVRNVA